MAKCVMAPGGCSSTRMLDGSASRGQHCDACVPGLGYCAGNQASGYRIPVQWTLDRRMVSLEAPPEPKASSQSKALKIKYQKRHGKGRLFACTLVLAAN